MAWPGKYLIRGFYRIAKFCFLGLAARRCRTLPESGKVLAEPPGISSSQGLPEERRLKVHGRKKLYVLQVMLGAGRVLQLRKYLSGQDLTFLILKGVVGAKQRYCR